jgi:hypothetical protein
VTQLSSHVTHSELFGEAGCLTPQDDNLDPALEGLPLDLPQVIRSRPATPTPVNQKAMEAAASLQNNWRRQSTC